MKIPLNWLKEYIDLEVGVDELCDRMTMLGLEIEAVERPGEEIQKVVVGEILSIEPHPDADKLVVCKTNVGADEPAQIVCGASNMKVGDKVPTALVGGTLPGGFKIGKRKMRGIESQGMMCSARELGLGEDHEGLLILEGDFTVGDDVRQPLGLDEVVLEIEVTPNRGDWAGLIGIARELGAAYGIPHSLPDVGVQDSGKKAAQSATGPRLKLLNTSSYGRVLTNGRGQVIYLFTLDRKNRSRCSGTCAQAWPPYIVKSKPKAGKGVRQKWIKTVRRSDGKRQVVYRGKPLYFYVNEGPRQVLFQDVASFGGTWYVVNKKGRAIR